MHPMLLPGTHLLRRGDGHHQAGLSPGTAVALPALTGDWTTDEVATARLLRNGAAVTDDQVVRRALPAYADGPTDRWPRHAVAALARRCPDRLADAVAGRNAHAVTVGTFGHPLAESLADDAVALCRRAGLRADRSARTPGRGAHGHRHLLLLLGVGEPHRELLDPLVHDGSPHLLVRLTEGEAVVGPLVAPGATACLRCLDAYRTEQDPSWPLLVEQYARAAGSDRADGVPEPADPALAAVALGWAVRDVASYAEGGSATTWSATVRLAPTLDVVETRRWPLHPACGCGWA